MKDMLKNKQIRGAIMTFVMIIFFAIIISMARNSAKQSMEKQNNENKNQKVGDINQYTNISSEKNIFNLEKVLNSKYNYTYTIITNTEKEIITGKKFLNKEKFNIINNLTNIEAAKIDKQFLIKKDNKYVLTENSISKYFIYSDINKLLDVLNMTNYIKESNFYNFEIEPIDFIDKFSFDSKYDSFEDVKDDNIKLYFKDNDVYKIEMNLSNYISILTNKKENKLLITLEYNNFNNVEDFEI